MKWSEEDFSKSEHLRSENVHKNNGGKTDRNNMGEAFRSLRTNLQYSDARHESGGKVLVLTSTISGEGKTFCSANIAASFALTYPCRIRL